MSTIQKLNVSLFKGIKKSQVDFVPGLNLLVGANNSGKSSLLQAIYLAFHFLRLTGGISETVKKKKEKDRLAGSTVRNVPLPLHDESYLSEGLKKRSARENSTSILVQIKDGPAFLETLTFPGGNTLVISSNENRKAGSGVYQEKVRKIINPKSKEFPLYIPTFSGVINREEIKQPEVISYYINSGKSSEILRNQLKGIPRKHLNKLNEHLKRGFGYEISASDTKEIFLSSIYKDQEYDNLDISSAGSGFQQILQILVQIVTSSTNTILIDEPDAHLHYKLQNVLYDILLDLASEGKQIIVSTHSQVFIKRAVQHGDRLILVNKKQDEQKPITQYGEEVELLYAEGIVDEADITQGGQQKIISLEDDAGSSGYNVVCEFLSKLGYQSPDFKIVSNSGSGNQIIAYAKEKKNIENIELKVLALRDSDSLASECIDLLKAKCKDTNVQMHFLEVHEVENYLINAGIIARFLQKKDVKTTTAEIEELIVRVVTEKKDILIDVLDAGLQGKYNSYSQDFIRGLGITFPDLSTKVRERRIEIRDKHFAYPFSLLPGKEIFGYIKQELHTKFHVTLSEIELARSFKVQEIPKEIVTSLGFFKKEVSGEE